MANYGNVPRGYSPISSFKEDLYKELDKPISTQNLEQFLEKFDKVIAEITRAKQGLEKDLASGKTVSEGVLSGILKEGKDAVEVYTKLNQKIAEFNTYSKAQKNFPDKYQNLYKLLNASGTVNTSAQLAKNMATMPPPSRPKSSDRFSGKSNQEIGKQILEERKRAEEYKRFQEQMSKIGEKGTGSPNARKGIVNIGNEKAQGKDLGIEQKTEQMKGLEDQAKETATVLAKVFDQQKGMFVDKQVPVGSDTSAVKKEAKKGEKTWEDRQKELANMTAEERKAEFEKQRMQMQGAKATANQEKKAEYQTWEDKKKALDSMSVEERKAFFQREREQASYNKKDESANSDSLQFQIQNYEQLGVKITELTQRAMALRSVLQQPSVSGESYDKYIQELSAVEGKLKELQKTKSLIDKQQQQPKQDQQIEPFKADPKNYQELVGWIDTLQSKIASLSSGLKNGTSSNFEKDQQAIAEYSSELKRLQGIKANLDKGEGLVGNDEPPRIQGVLGLLKETISVKTQLAQEKANIISSQDIESTMGNIKNLQSRMKELGAIWKEVASNSILVSALSAIGNVAKNVATTVGGALVQGFKSAISGAKQLASTIFNLASGAFNALKSAVSTTLGNMQRLVSGGFNAVKNGVKSAVSGFQSLKSHMQSIIKKGTPNLMKSFSSLKSMLMRRVKRTFISSIFNQAKEGLQQLAKSSDDFNQSMSNIKNTAKQSAGNLSMVLGNLIQTLEPALMTLLGWFNSVMEAINGLFALLGGKSTMLVAKKNTDDYAKSLGGAGGAAKDLNHQLYGFDELTRQDDNSGGGGGSGGKIEYEEKEVADMLGGINDFFQQMMEAFQSGQFERVGELVAEQLNNLTKIIDDWVVGIRSKATEWASNIARILNGLFSNKELFENLGKLFADGLNLAFDVVNTFLKTLKFDEIGKSLGTAINSIFKNVEWDLVGETFATYFNSIWTFLGSTFEEIKWGNIGEQLSKGFNSLFSNLDWEAFKKMWAEGVNGVFNMLYTFVHGIKWGSIAGDIDANLTDLITNKIKWDTIKKALSESVSALQDVFHVLANSNFFINLASKLSEVFGGVLDKINWDTLVSDIGVGLAKLKDAFWSLIDKVDIPSLATKLSSALNGLMTNKNVTKAWDDADAKATAGINKIIKAIGIIAKPASEGGLDVLNLSQKLGKRVGKLLNNCDFDELSGIAKNGLLKITEAFSGFVTGLDLETIATDLASGVNSFFAKDENGGSPLIEASKRASEGLNAIIDGFKSFVSEINFSEVAGGLASGIQTLISEIKFDELISAIGTGVAEASSAFFGLVTRVFTGTDEEGNKIGKTLGEQISDGINDIFKTKDGEVNKEMFSELGKNLGEAIKGIFSDIATFFDETDWEAIGEAIGEAIASIDWLGIATTLLRLLYNALISASNLFGGAVTRLVNAILGIDVDEARNGFKEDCEELARNSAQDFVDEFATAFEGVKQSKEVENTIIEAYKEWAGVSTEEATDAFKNHAEELASDVLFITTDELKEKLSSVEGFQEVRRELASALGVTVEEAGQILSEYNIAESLAQKFGMSWEEAVSYSQGNVQSNAMLLASQYGLTYEDALTYLGEGGYSALLADALGVSYEDAVKLLANEKNFDALSELFSENASTAKDKIMEGLYENSDSVESVMAYFKSLGVEISEELASSFVGAKPKILSSNRELLNALKDDQTVDEVKNTFKEYGIKITNEFAQAIAGQGAENIDTALALLGEGVNQSTLSAMDMANIHENLMNFMETSGKDITEVARLLMSDNKEELAQVARDLGIEIGEDLGSVTPEALKKALLEGKKSVQEASDELANIAGQVEQKTNIEENSTDAGKAAAEGVAKGQEENQSEVEEATKGITSAVTEKYEALPDEVKPYAEQLMEYICTALADKDGTVKSAIEAVAQGAVDRAKEILNGEAGIEIVKAFVEGMQSYLEAPSTLALFNGASGASTKLGDAIKEAISEVLTESDAKDIGSKFASGVKSGISSVQVGEGYENSPYDWAVDVASAITTVFGNSAYTIGNEFGNGILYGLYNADAYSVADSWAWIVLDVIQGKINAWNGETIGANMVIGMINGFNAYGSMLVSTMANICRTTVSTAREILGIHSPSKVFEQIGDYVMEGMQIGLEDSGKDAIQSVADVTKAMTAEGESAQIKTDIGIMVDGLDNVTSKMTRLAQIFSDIGQTIAEMGKLDIPAVASGRVIPYNTNVNSASSVAQPAFSNNNLEDALFSAFNRAMGMEQNQQPIEIKLVVDGRTLADIVTKKQREQSRAWGV